MRDMALIVSESDRPSPKVWQPWYMEGGLTNFQINLTNLSLSNYSPLF